MRRLLGLKDSISTPSSDAKGKGRQRDFTSASTSLPSAPSACTPMEVHVSTEVHSAADRQGFHPLASTTSLASPSPASSDLRPLPPEIRVPTHPYPYWQGYSHTPSSSSQSSLESPITPSHVSWLSIGNAPGNPSPPRNGSNTIITASVPLPAGPSSSVHSFAETQPSPSPHFPPPPPTNPPPNVSVRLKLLHPTKSSHSLRVPVQESFNQQLSPIVEQDYFSPEKRPVSLPSSSHEGGSRSSNANTTRTSAVMLTPVSPGSDIGTATVTPVSPVPITPILVGVRGTLSTPQMHPQAPATPSYLSSSVPFTRRKEEEGNDSPRPSPSPVSTFILRPLNRSISVSSTRTHQSSVSCATPPVIPPLDLKPEFKGSAFLITPTSLHSRGFLDVCARDDDSVSDRRESFVTAQTGAGRESKYSFGQEETFVDADDGYRRNSDGTIQQFDSHFLDDTTDAPLASHGHPIPQNFSKLVKPTVPARTILHPLSAPSTSSSPPSYKNASVPGPYDSDNQPQPSSQSQLPQPASPTLYPSRLAASAPSLQGLGTSISTSSSFIDRRFASSSLYIRTSSERESERGAGSKWTLGLERTDTIKILFWLGFIAPWCWLIGGWLITAKSYSRGDGSGSRSAYNNGYHGDLGGGGSSLLPLWMSRSKSMHSFDTTKMQHGYPFVAPSVLSLAPPPPPYQSQRTVAMLTPKPVGREVKNPWVRRCRIAAVTSGVLIVAAFLVALVVVGTIHA